MAIGPIKMSYVFEVLRGWPLDGAVESSDSKTDSSVIATGGFTNGDVVTFTPSGTLIKVTTPTFAAGFVVRGEKDSASVTEAGHVPVILWSNFLARTQNFNTSSSWAPGLPVTVKNNKLDVAGGTDPIIGFVKKVNPPVGGSASGDIEFVKF